MKIEIVNGFRHEDEEWNFIYNRFDLISVNDAMCFCIFEDTGLVHYIHAYREDDIIHLGLWMNPIEIEIIDMLCDFIYKQLKGIKRVVFQYYPHSRGYISSLLHKQLFRPGNHWKLILPNSFEELASRMSKKFNYNVRREKRIANDEIGPLIIQEYKPETLPQNIIETYYNFKEETHSVIYTIPSEEYIEHYHVTNIYTLEVNGNMEAILFSCEQTDTVYIENLSYNPKLAKYSLGKILYYEFLSILIQKGKKAVYLGSGQQIYKSWYGGIETVVYSVTKYFSALDYYSDVLGVVIRRVLKVLFKRTIRIKI